MLPRRLSAIFSGLGSAAASKTAAAELQPTLKVQTDRVVYRPGDQIVITVEISNPSSHNDDDMAYSLLIERLGFEIKGIEKLDSQWFATQKPVPGSKQRRGEYVFMEASTPALVTNQIVSPGATKSYVVRSLLPSIIPPSYKGATIRYMYYVRSTMSGQWLILENAHSRGESVKDFPEMEARTPLQVWVTQKTSGLGTEDGISDAFWKPSHCQKLVCLPTDGLQTFLGYRIVPSATMQIDMYWKETDGDSEWERANDIYDGIEDGYESSRDEISSVSSYNPMKEHMNRTLGSQLSLQSARSSNKDTFPEGERTSLSSNLALPLLSSAEVMYDTGADLQSPKNSSAVGSPSRQQKLTKTLPFEDEARASTSPAAGAAENLASEGFIRGRSYNIRLDDKVLLRFSPKNSDSNYYFSDMIGGTLTFFHEKGARRCLEVSITLETSETISRRYVHPSRKNSPTITKVQSDHYEVVADLVQTSFLFSIPMDGPMSFSTPHVSIKWVLRFEFFTTPKNVDWTRYDHPLLVEGRDKSEWVLPIVVHAPPGVGPNGQSRNEKSLLGTVVGA